MLKTGFHKGDIRACSSKMILNIALLPSGHQCAEHVFCKKVVYSLEVELEFFRSVYLGIVFGFEMPTVGCIFANLRVDK